jgi:hypothetical protein
MIHFPYPPYLPAQDPANHFKRAINNKQIVASVHAGLLGLATLAKEECKGD